MHAIILHNGSSRVVIVTGCHYCRHGKNFGTCGFKLGDEVLVKVWNNTTVQDLLEQLDKACKGGRIQDSGSKILKGLM